MNVFNIKKMPLILKIIVGGIPMLMGLSYLIWIYYDDANNTNQFFKLSFSSTVVKTSIYHGRSKAFHLKNGLRIYFDLNSQGTAQIGDSIKKTENTYMYNLYRKDTNGNYVLYKEYNFMHVN